MLVGMKLSVQNRYSGTVEQTFTSHITKSVREEACRQSGAKSWEVTVTESADGGVTVEVERMMSPNLPDHIAKLVGGHLTIHQTEQWSPPHAGGSRQAVVKLTIKGQPASMHGHALLAPDGDGTLETVTGEVKVAVPIIGRKFEPDIVKVIESALRIEQQVGEEWLTANR